MGVRKAGASDCTSSCGTVTVSEVLVPRVGNGAACVDTTYSCQPGNGQCRVTVPPACPNIVSVQASSQMGNWNPENVLNTAHRTYWMSEVNGNQDEWVQFEFAEPAVVGSAEIRYNNGRQGRSPKIQGSNDAVSWDDLAEVEPWDWPNDSRNFRKGVVDLPDWAPTYKYFRYHSGPTVYVLLNHITFECVAPQPQKPNGRRLLAKVGWNLESAERTVPTISIFMLVLSASVSVCVCASCRRKESSKESCDYKIDAKFVF